MIPHSVKRFLVTLSFLVMGLFALVSSVDATLDHLAKSPVQSSFVTYDQKGSSLLVYTGELSQCHSFNYPSRVSFPAFLRRAKAILPGTTPVSSTFGSDWL